MNWNRIAKIKPPTDKKVLVAYGYIFEEDDFSIDGYDTKKFSDHDLGFLKTANNGKYCFYKGDTAIAFWCEITEPKL